MQWWIQEGANSRKEVRPPIILENICIKCMCFPGMTHIPGTALGSATEMVDN